MKDETRLWLEYAKENFESAKVLLQNELYNPSLQNVQQCVEKALKAFLIEKSYKLKRTHSIAELKNILKKEVSMWNRHRESHAGIKLFILVNAFDFFSATHKS